MTQRVGTRHQIFEHAFEVTDDSRPARPATASCGRVVDETQTVDKLLSMSETVADPDDTAFGVLTMKDAP